MAVVDLVFADSIQNGLFKQNILDIMELYGLISKFSSSSSKDCQVVEYCVPAQLRYKSPISWSVQDKWSTSTIYPFPWCICSTWALFINGARLVNGMRCAFQLSLICRKGFIKVVLKMNQRCCSVTGSSLTAASTKMANNVRDFLEASLKALTSGLFFLQSLRLKLCVACCHCLNNGDKCSKHKSTSCSEDGCLHLLRVHPEEELFCTKRYSDKTLTVSGLKKWFQAYTAQVFFFSLKSSFLISQTTVSVLFLTVVD